MSDCLDFRRRLEALLAGRPDPPGLTALGWHEHLLGCQDCRALLEQEEALELCLASLPDPDLPPDLTARLLARLRREHASLDELLALDQVDVPAGLAGRVRRGLAAARAAERASESEPVPVPVPVPAAESEPGAVSASGTTPDVDARLDALLDRLPAEPVPADLARRVLAGLRAERARARFTLLRGGAWRRVAAAVLVSAGAFAAWRLTRPTGVGPAVDDEDVIAMLPVLEVLEALDELDPLEQEIVAALDVSHQALLDLEDR